MMILAVAALLGLTAPAAHADTGFTRGPDPTDSSIEQTRGSYSVGERSISRFSADGFRGGTMHYPTGTDETFGVVAISPGYTAGESSISWLGPRLASFGFVAVTFHTNARYDQPRQRATQLLSALDHAIDDDVVGPLIDEHRQAVMGHSMGGGGALRHQRHWGVGHVGDEAEPVFEVQGPRLLRNVAGRVVQSQQRR